VLNLWRASREPAADGNRALRRWCREHFLSFVRMREWADLREQLAEMTRSTIKVAGDAAPRARGAAPDIPDGFPRRHRRARRGAHLPWRARHALRDRAGTPLQKRLPHWIVAASLVETQRLYARMVAQVQPSWIEAAGAHLVKRTYGEAEWDPSAAWHSRAKRSPCTVGC
jgi:ATP-dependent helicase HrpA